jgi:SagB-type dehydrogenase family enzyme
MRNVAQRDVVQPAVHTLVETERELPLRPRFIDELVVAPIADGIAVDGTDQLHLVWGETATNVLPSLIPLLDGTRTVAELSAALPHVPAQRLQSVLSSLHAWGLVEEGTQPGVNDLVPNPNTLSFFRRYVGAAGLNRNGLEAYERLVSTEVLIVDSSASKAASHDLQILLTKTGAGRVTILSREGLDPALSLAGRLRNAFIVSLSLTDHDHEELARLDDFCADRQLSWLRICVDERKSFADIGPVFSRKERACYRCFLETHSRVGTALSKRGQLDACGLKFWISMAGAEIILRVSRLTPTDTEGFRRYNLEDGSVQSLRFAPIPGCPRCRPLSPDKQMRVSSYAGRIDVGMLFEEYVSNRSRPSNPSKADPADLQAVSELSRQSKRMPNSRQYGLAREAPDLQRPILDVAALELLDSQPLTLAKLGSLLMMTGGIRRSWSEKPTVQRWAATGGNLGSVELYVVVRNVEGLPPGCYFYQPREHALALFRPHRALLPVEELMRRSVSCDQSRLPDAMVLFTGAFHRVSKKYGPFGYRLVNFDAGVAFSQLLLLAKAMGIRSHLASRWADDLIEQELGLDPMAEQVTAAVLLNQDEGTRLPSGRVDGHSELPASMRIAQAFCDLTVWNVFEMAYRESRIKEANLRTQASSVPDELQHANYRFLPGIAPLPVPATNGGSLGDILRSRRSIRQYSTEPVSLNQLSTMLSVAHRMDAGVWPEEHLHGQALSFLVLAQRVVGLSPGLYLYDAANACLRLLRDGLGFEETSELYVQDEFALAPVAVWMVGNLAAACARHGAFGHRQLLVRAGAAGNHLWMAGLGMGLSGSLVAGIVAGAAAKELGLDGYLKASLLALAIGYSVPGSSPAANVIQSVAAS